MNRGATSILDGLRFVRTRRIITVALLADLAVGLFGSSQALLPTINAERFGGRPETLGILVAAPAVGGLVAAVLSAPIARVVRRERAMLMATLAWSLPLAGLALTGDLALAVALLAVSGALGTVMIVLRTTLIQTATPEPYRGRVTVLEYLVANVGTQLGAFRAGAIGSGWSATAAMLVGAASCALVTGLAAAYPRRGYGSSGFAAARADSSPAA